jgi:hypothetical protein
MLMMTLMQGGGVGIINSNGTLRIGGVRPGRTRIVALAPPELKGFTLVRVERNGVEIKEFESIFQFSEALKARNSDD